MTQIQFTNCVISPGDIFTVTTVPSLAAGAISPGTAGTAKFWDFTNAAGTSQYIDTVFVASQTASTAYPGATLMRKSGYYYKAFKVGSIGLEFLGLNTGLIFSDPELIVPSTLSYGSNYNDTWTYTVSLSANNNCTSTANVSKLADAWGVIFTPGGNFYNTIRVKSVYTNVASYTSQADRIYNHVDYHWYQEGIHDPVFSLITWTLSGTKQQTASYLDFGTNITGINQPALHEKESIYPNPFTTAFTLGTINDAVNVSLFDLCGKEIINMPYETGKVIETAFLPPGIYTLKIVDVTGKAVFQKLSKSN